MAGAFFAGAALVTGAVDCDEAAERAATVLRLLVLLTAAASGPGWSAGTQCSFPYCGAFLEDRVARGQRPRTAPRGGRPTS
ncbi:hypothetical protein GCM10027300_05960 [Modestobacter lapidis]